MTQFTAIHADMAILQTSWWYICNLNILTAQSNKIDCWWRNVLHWFLQEDLEISTLLTFTLCIVTSEITEILDAETKIDLLIMSKIKIKN